MVKLKILISILLLISLTSYSKQAANADQTLFINDSPNGGLSIQIKAAGSGLATLPAGGADYTGDTNWWAYILARTTGTGTITYKASSAYDTSTYLSKYENLIPTFEGNSPSAAAFLVIYDISPDCTGQTGGSNPPNYVTYKVKNFCNSADAVTYHGTLSSTFKVVLDSSGVVAGTSTPANGNLNASIAPELVLAMDDTVICA